jgi:putative methyltransferase (TIGR04325 family)
VKQSLLRRFVKPWIPPAIWGALHRAKVGRIISFKGDYPSWKAAAADAEGYDSAEILNRVAAGTRKVVAGEAAYERDSVVFDHVEYSWPLLASLLQIASERGSLRVIDFGGSLGSTWRQNRAFLSRLSVPIRWRVVEQDNFVALGAAEFSDAVLEFMGSITAAAQGGVDAALFCASLCYLADPEDAIAQVEAAGAPFLVIDRLPVSTAAKDRIMVQRVNEPIYVASYPIRIFAEDLLLAGLLRNWRLIERWDSELQVDPNSQLKGFFLERR